MEIKGNKLSLEQIPWFRLSNTTLLDWKHLIGWDCLVNDENVTVNWTSTILLIHNTTRVIELWTENLRLNDEHYRRVFLFLIPQGIF